MRKQADALIKQENVFEVLLVNRYQQVTEGSKSNAFFIFGDRVVTAPSQAVLPGITRKYVMECCRTLGIRLEEKPVALSSLSQADAAFISGTSPNIMPIRQINQIDLNPQHPLLLKLMIEYESRIQAYIQKNAKQKSTLSP